MTTTQKIYIHLEEDNHGIRLTIPILVTEEMTVQQVIDIYVTKFNSKYHHDLLYDSDGNMVILSSNNITLKSHENKLYHKHKIFLDVFDGIDDSNSNDVFAIRSYCPIDVNNNNNNITTGSTVDSYGIASSASATSSFTSAVVDSNNPLIVSNIIKEKVIATKDNTSDESKISKVTTITKEQKSVLTSLLAEKSYRKVREVASHIINTVVDKTEQLFAVISLAEVFYHTKRYEKAIEICQKALQQQHQQYSTSITSTTCHNSMELHYILIKSLMATQDYSEAEIVVTKAMKIQGDSKLVKKQPKHMQSISFQLELIALQAESIFEKGQHNEAVAIINQIMSNPNAESSIPILLAYASFAKQYNKFEEPIRALLKAVVLKGDNERVKKMLAELLSSNSGIDELLRQVPPEGKNSSSGSSSSSSSKGKCEVYAFLGYITKTHSCISSSIRLYQLALEAYSTSANSALNLTHLYEISVDYNRCIQTIISFCKSNPTMKLGPHVSCNDILEVLLNNNNNNNNNSSIVSLEWIDIGSDSSNGYVNVTIEYPSTDDSGDVTIDSGLISPSEHGSYSYSEVELDLLALFVTAVKILYLQGNISLLPALFRLLEPCRLLSATSLHETTIRNEIAYYQELGRILCYRQKYCSYGIVNTLNTLVDADKLPIQNAYKRPIYLIGDSHCIPGTFCLHTSIHA
jgi:tetratricopeptide (TPR) repeat protein